MVSWRRSRRQISKPVATKPLTPNFDRVARLYRWAEYAALGPLLTRVREHFLPEIAGAREALLLGDGDGRFTAALLRRGPQMRAHAVDGSAAMLQLLLARCRRDGTVERITVQQAPVLQATVPRGCDLIVTHFLLDCLSQADVQELAGRLAQETAPGCQWIISEFGLPRRAPWRGLARVYLRALYAAFRVLTGLQPQQLPDPQQALAAAGFRRLRRTEHLHGFLYSELWGLPAAHAGDETTQGADL